MNDEASAERDDARNSDKRKKPRKGPKDREEQDETLSADDIPIQIKEDARSKKKGDLAAVAPSGPRAVST